MASLAGLRKQLADPTQNHPVDDQKWHPTGPASSQHDDLLPQHTASAWQQSLQAPPRHIGCQKTTSSRTTSTRADQDAAEKDATPPTTATEGASLSPNTFFAALL